MPDELATWESPSSIATETPIESGLAPAVPMEEPDEVALPRKPLGIFFWVCVAWLAFLTFIAIFVPYLGFKDPNNYYDFTIGSNAGWSVHHLLGTDQLSRDTLARLAWGARVSLAIGLGATAIGMALGSSLGMMSAYIRGRFDAGLSFFMYCGLAFPAIVAVIAILDFWGQSEWHIILVLGLFSIPLIYRVIRAATLATATKEYVTAAKSQGATSTRVLSREIFPNVAPAIIVYAIFTLGGVIAIEGALAFLGLSVPSPTASWGNLISDASNDPQAPWVFILSPAIALCFTLVSLYWVAEKIRQRFDPGEQKL